MCKTRPRRDPRWVKAVTEYLPLGAFLLAYKVGDLTLAIQAIVAATVLAVVVSLIAVRRLPLLTLLAAGLVILFGGVSLALGDDSFYKMKPTVVYALFAIGLVVARSFGRLLLKAALEDVWRLTDAGWRGLTTQYAVFFLAMAGLNELVWRLASEQIWVAFKVIGGMALVVLFTLSRAPYARRHALPVPVKKDNPDKPATP